MKCKYNDNELLYLISENDESAFEILCEKYRPLIISRIRNFKIHEKNFNDFYQECLMVLDFCSKNYREDKNYTFNIYLDVSIQNKIRNLLRKDKKYFYNVSFLDIETIDKIVFKEDKKLLLKEDEKIFIEKIKNSFEKEVMKLYFDGNNIKDIANKLGCPAHRLYYVIGKYKNKHKNRRVDLCGGIFSDLEQKVYELYIKNYRPRDISYFLECEINTVYNAIKRIKAKSK